jgi:cytochrome c
MAFMNLELRQEQKRRFNSIADFPERCLCFTLAIFVLVMIVSLSSSSAVSAGPPGSDGGDASRGQAVFEKRCTGCHALDQEKEGPRLRGVFGRKAGSIYTFEYSDALKAANITWNADSLEQWLTDPDKIVPDNDMAFRVPKAQERTDIIAYLRQLSK